MSELGNKEIMAKNIRKYMERLDKDRTEICKDLDISYSTFTDWVNAKKYPRIDKIELMAKYFGVSKADLVEDSEKQEKDNLEIEPGLHLVESTGKKIHIKNNDALYSLVYEIIKMTIEKEEALHFPDKKKTIITVKNPAPPYKEYSSDIIAFPTEQGGKTEKEMHKELRKFTDVESAKKYLSSLKSSLSAFNGGKELSDEAIIDMANILYNDKHK